MNNRQAGILGILQRQAYATTFGLAAMMNAPEASVRRDIQALRNLGYRIIRNPDVGGYQYDGCVGTL